MSMMKCSGCGALVDTDAEPESFIEVGDFKRNTDYICLCRTCREAYEEEQERRWEELNMNGER